MLLHSALEKTRFEMMHNEKPNLSFIKLFGCVEFMHIEKPFRKKLDPTSKKGILLGNSDNSKCYLIGFEDEKGELKIRRSRNVRFDENEYYFKHKKAQKLVEDTDNDSNEVFFWVNSQSILCFQKNVDEALQNPNWFEARKIEYDSLVEKQCLVLNEKWWKTSRKYMVFCFEIRSWWWYMSL